METELRRDAIPNINQRLKGNRELEVVEHDVELLILRTALCT